MKRAFVSIVAIFAALGVANAADLPQQAPPYQPAPPPVVAAGYNWTGVYIGANVGGAWQQFTAIPVAFVNGALINPSAPTTFNGGGVLAGGQAGFNYQVSNLLVGLEGEFLWTNTKITATQLGTGAFTGAVGTGTMQTDWYATLG